MVWEKITMKSQYQSVYERRQSGIVLLSGINEDSMSTLKMKVNWQKAGNQL